MKAGNSVLKIVIVYEDLVTGIEATAVLSRLAGQLETEFQIKSDTWRMDNSAWKFEMLREPELWNQAATEAVGADIIIVSVGGAQLPACVRNWIENVLPMKEGRPAALVAMLDRRNDASGEPPRLGAYLRRLAEEYGLDFFCNTNDPPPRVESGIESILSRSEGDSAIWRGHSLELPREDGAPMNVS